MLDTELAWGIKQFETVSKRRRITLRGMFGTSVARMTGGWKRLEPASAAELVALTELSLSVRVCSQISEQKALSCCT